MRESRLIGSAPFFRGLAGALAFSFLSVFGYAQSLAVSTMPVFIGMSDGDCFPLRVTVANRGPDAFGQVLIKEMGVSLHYPVELPRGSMKSFIAYPFASTIIDPMEISLETDKGEVAEKWTNPVGSFVGRQVLTITDNPGEAGFLKLKPAGSKMEMDIQDIYGKPELLPDRAAGYGKIYAVLLGSGAERMSDAATVALQQYALSGGKVVFFGGAASIVARDPRWRAFSPVQDIQTRNLGSCTISLTGYKLHLASPATEAIGTLTAHASFVNSASAGVGANVQVAYKPIGAGTIYFFGLDPFDAPLSGAEGRPELMSVLLGLQKDPNRRAQILGSVDPSGYSDYGNPYGTSYATTTTYGPGGTTSVVYDESSDPFSVSLPSASLVGIILVVYVILVAPVNLLILRKLRRSEWAWVTAPALSLAFAAIFFRFAGNLYSASLSKKLNGIVVADQSEPTGYVLGQSQLFFPRGGAYDLGLENVECVTNADESGMYRYGRMNEEDIGGGFDAVDDGNVAMPRFATNNLGFHQIDFRQRMSGSWPTADLNLTGHKLTGHITNASKYDLEGAELYVQDKLFILGTIKAGETKQLDEIGRVVAYPSGSSNHGPPLNGMSPDSQLILLLSHDRYVLTGQIKNFEAGPQIGTAAHGSSVTLFENLGAYR